MRFAVAVEIGVVFATFCVAPLAAQSRPAEATVDFLRDVRPILAKRCFACHGPDAAGRKAKLRLDTESGAKTPRDGRAAFVPGNVAASEALARVGSLDDETRMPPPSAGPALSPEEIAILDRWVAAGAVWKAHWSFVPPTRPEAPEVRHSSWTRRPLDAFIAARLEKAGLDPAPEADRRTLLRRLSLDLIGLPPTPKEAEAFEKDTAPDAYSRAVERLLASPSFGEKWARRWLDLARFADTRGYEKDLRRPMWPWRDWLIRALNDDMPFDRFTERVLAGDLLPNATEADRIATAFHRMTMTNDEGGTDDEEFRVAAVKDRTDTTMAAWMGLTFGCAKCHSHKYDPITHEEYYRLYAFFDQTEDSDRYDDAPVLPYLSEEDRSENGAIDRELAAIEESGRRVTPEREAAFREWMRARSAQSRWRTFVITGAHAESGATFDALPDGSRLVRGAVPPTDVYEIDVIAPVGTLTGIRVEALTDPSLPSSQGPGRAAADANFVISEFTVERGKTPAESAPTFAPIALTGAAADFEQGGWPAAAAIDGDPKTGWAIAPAFGKPHAAVFRFAAPVESAGGETWRIRLAQRYGAGLVVGRFRLSVTSESAPAFGETPIDVGLALEKSPGDRTASDWEILQDAWRAADPLFAADREKAHALRARRREAVPLPVMRELPAQARRRTRVHRRGSFLDPGQDVSPGVPEFLPPLPLTARRDRSGLAAWLVARENPLTARVQVNRVWADLFGRGLVESEEDFGSQGTPPSHPELLDHLANVFLDRGQSLKALIREIVLSATYRESARPSDLALARDPENRLLSHAPRVRLDAEAIRDQALAVSGLLSAKMFGPSVMPYQPDGVWAVVYSGDRWETSAGEDGRRRGIYTFMRRTSAYPAALTFDATSRETCTIRRIRSNTPLQALTTLNDPVFVEAAQALARKCAGEGAPGAVAAAIFRRATGRTPDERETAALLGLYETRLAAFSAAPDSARRFATEPLGPAPAGADIASLAAWTAVANTCLNLDETLVRG